MQNRRFIALAGLVASGWAATTMLSCTNARSGAPTLAGGRADSARVRSDIQYLASDALEGRGTGTPGNDAAAAFAARRYAALGLQTVSPGYLQPFTARSAMLAHSGGPSAMRTQNVVAFLRGTDPALRGQTIVIGAHIDHL